MDDSGRQRFQLSLALNECCDAYFASALGHSRPIHRGPKSTFVCFGPKATKMVRRGE
jgi:hypothetical protein